MVKMTAVGLVMAAQVWAASPLPLHFEPNRGQAPAEARYLARVRNATVSLTEGGIFVDGPGGRTAIRCEGSAATAPWTPAGESAGTTSYWIGNDSSRWLRSIPNFNRVERKEIYPGIDLVVYGAEGRLEYDFVLAPGADPERIRLRFDGPAPVLIDPNGDLAVPTAQGALVQKKPVIYQTLAGGSKLPVAGGYRLTPSGAVEFSVAAYDRTHPLTIDPVLVSATLLGGSGDDRVFFTDPNVAVAGSTTSVDFPDALGRHSGTDIFLYLPATQSTIVFGGSGDDIVTSLSAAPYGGYLLVGGYTNSQDFPITSSYSAVQPFQAQYGGGDWDGFLVLFSLGNPVQPFYSTYLGGSGDDRVLSVDAGGAPYGIFGAAGSTTSSDFPLANAWQATPGGSTDGFVTLMSANSQTPAFSSYLGGSGDDRALALAIAFPNGLYAASEIYVGGVTGSSDWALPGSGQTAALQGASDAFLIHGHLAGGYARLAPASAVLWGGSGDDRITQVAGLPNGSVAVAGVTTSADFVAGGAVPGGFRGSSDVFAAVVSGDLASVSFARLIGGSGDQEPASLATNRFNELLIAGWTSSPDFPLVNPIQAVYGGGASDGFLVHLDSSGQTIWSSFFGGSGADRITTARFDSSQQVDFGGYTDSTDLPLAGALQTINAGSNDGFFGTLNIPVIHAQGLTVGKDLAGQGYAFLGDTSNYVGVPLTIASVDPSTALVATLPSDPGQASVTVAVRASDSDLAGRSFLVFCLTGNGSTTLALTAPGYPAITVPIRCVPSALSLSPAAITVPMVGSGGQQTAVYAMTVALDPATGNPLQAQNIRGGLPPISIGVTSSDSTVASLSIASTGIDQYSTLSLSSPNNYTPRILFTALAVGEADLTFTNSSSFAVVPSATVHVRVTGPAVSTILIPPLAKDFVDQASVSIASAGAYPTNAQITVTSSDSTKVRLTASPVVPGAGSITLSCCASSGYVSFFVEVLDDSGPASLTASIAGGDPVTVPVALTDAKAGFYDSYRRLLTQSALPMGSSLQASLKFTAYLPGAIPYAATVPYLRSGAAPLQIHLANSNPSAVSTSLQDWAIQPGNVLVTPSISFSPVLAGSSQISARWGAASSAADSAPLSVYVSSNQPAVSSATIGINLQTALSVTLPSLTSPAAVTVTSADPSRLVLSTDPTKPGQASITVSTTWGFQVYAQALAGWGDVDVSATLAGAPAAHATVHLAPSGFAWYSEVLAITTADIPSPTIQGYVLDPVSFAPLTAQMASPGSGSVALQIPDSTVVKLASASVALSTVSTSTAVALTPVAPGATQIAILQPPGSVAPAGRHALRVTVKLPSFTMYPVKVGKFLQLPVSAQFQKSPPSPLPPLSFTSSDSSNLLVSATRTDPGSATANVSAAAPYTGSAYQPVYVQAIDGPADVTLSASVAGYADGSTVVQIVPTSLAISSGYYASAALETNTQAGPSSLALSAAPLGNGSGEFWAGFPSSPVTINNSNPAVAAVPNSPILNALTTSSQFQVNPLTPGEADLTVAWPAGFAAGASATPFKVTVDGPSLVLPNLTLGQDLETYVTLGIKNGSSTAPSGADVTFASSDPTKILLAAAAGMPGAPSITVHVYANQSIAIPVYVQALDNRGAAAIQTSAPGYLPGTATVTLVPTRFNCDQTSLTLTVPNPATVYLYAVPASQTYQSYGTYHFRAGVAPFAVGAASANTAVATVSPAQAPVGPGSSQIGFTVQSVGGGSTAVSFDVPAPYLAPSSIAVTAQGGQLSMYNVSGLGKNLQTSLQLGAPPGVSVTVASSDPSRLLVSASAAAPGQASATVTQNVVYAQALGDSGSVTLTASAPGYQTATAQVALTPAAAVFFSVSSSALTTLSPPVTLQVQLVSYTSGSGSYYPPQPLRAGAPPLSVPVILSDATVGTVSPAPLVFNPGDSVKTLTFQPTGAGTELISLGVPAGLVDPLSAREQLLTVTAPRLILGGTTAIGKNLQANLTAALSAAPAQALTVTLNSADPSSLELGQLSGSLGASVGLNFAANSTASAGFRIAGLADSGSVALHFAAPGLAALNDSVTLEPSGFRFASTAVTVASGAGIYVQVLSSALFPGSLAPAGDFAVRSDIGAPVLLTVTSSNPSIAAVSSAPLSFGGGSSQENLLITAGSPGVATLTITPPSGWSKPSSGSQLVVTVH